MTSQKPFIHEKTFSIAWGDMDALGHVNNARYFDYFQEARIEWLAAMGLKMNQDTGPVVVTIAATFVKPVIYPATLTLKTYIESIGRSSMGLTHALFQDDVLVTKGECTIVWVDYKTQKSVLIPDFFRAIVKD